MNEKIHRNPARVAAAGPSGPSGPDKYIPNYKLMGLTPQAGNISPPVAVVIPVPKTEAEIQETLNNPRISRTAIPYAVPGHSPMGTGKSPMLNVGNNMEHTWSSVDNEIIVDDLNLQNASMSEDKEMIDNNDFVSNEALGLPSEPKKEVIDKKNSNYTPNCIGEYILFVKGKIIYEGTLDNVQEEVRKIIFGANELYNTSSVDDIEVLKRIKIKIGVFLE